MEITEALRIFNININKEFINCKSLEEAGNKVIEIKNRIKKIFRKKALTTHPDRNGNNEKMVKLIEAKNACMELKVLPKPRESIINVGWENFTEGMSDMYTEWTRGTTGTNTWYRTF